MQSYDFGELMRRIGVPMMLCVMVSEAFFDSLIPAGIAYLPLTFFYSRVRSAAVREAQKAKLKKQFLYAAGLLSDYLRSGYSIENALVRSQAELREVYGEESRIFSEWKLMAAGLGINRSVEEVFHEFGVRSEVEEIRSFSEIFGIVKRSGGQLGEVIGSITEILSGQFAVEEQIETMITAKRFEQKIMNLMPLVILMYIKWASPDFMAAMYEGIVGRLIMAGCLVIYAAAYFWSEQIMKMN